MKQYGVDITIEFSDNTRINSDMTYLLKTPDKLKSGISLTISNYVKKYRHKEIKNIYFYEAGTNNQLNDTLETQKILKELYNQL